MFAKMFVRGTNETLTTQTSREPIELDTTEKYNGDGLFDRFDMSKCSLQEIEDDLTEKLQLFIEKVNEVRENDAKFNKAQLAELKRQRKVVKQLKKTLK